MGLRKAFAEATLPHGLVDGLLKSMALILCKAHDRPSALEFNVLEVSWADESSIFHFELGSNDDACRQAHA